MVTVMEVMDERGVQGKVKEVKLPVQMYIYIYIDENNIDGGCNHLRIYI